jgi:F-type H+-transporting ATPase subunit epsilon
MTLEIITPDKKIYNGEIKLVQVPGTKGSFEVLKNHAPIISTLQEGKVKVVAVNDQVFFFQITGGVIEVKQNKAILLAESVID